MQKVFNNLREIEEVVKELLPPRVNHLLDSFKLEFKLSSNSWKDLDEMFYNVDYALFFGERNIQYFVSKASIQEEIDYLSDSLDPYYEYSDDYSHIGTQSYLRNRIKDLEKQL
jgi:hypothetical protein